MAYDNLQTACVAAKPAEAGSIVEIAWNAAWDAYRPVGEMWENEHDEAEAMPRGEGRDAAFKTFYHVSIPRYQRARDEFMRVPAPTFETLLAKMKVADPSDDEHYDLCLADMKRLVADLKAARTGKGA